MENDERFLNLAVLNIGEALVGITNLRLRGNSPGDAYRPMVDKLHHAIAALHGEVYTVVVDPKHLEKGNPGS